MGKLGCNIEGNLNEGKFSEPLPWIGIYIATASFACAIAMACDLIHGFRLRKFWFPSRFFAINATSLTVITVAIKLSVDLNTAMPRRVEQLSKLSSSALICTAIGNSIPSLGSMEIKEMYMNVLALAILVITVVVNICIQLGTGVIYIYWQEHACLMFLMIVLLLILIFSSVTVPVTKRYMEMKYKKRHDIALCECSDTTDKALDVKLKEDLMKFWMMAHTCSPQFVMGRSVMCTASGAFCLLNAGILAEIMVRSYLMPWSFKFCVGESDYKWSTILVMISQTVAVAIGTIAPAVRWFTAVNFRCPTLEKRTSKKVFTLERYWIQGFLELKECPLVMQLQNRRCRKLVYGAKNKFLDCCIGMQTGIVFTCKAIQFLSVYFVSRVLIFCRKLKFTTDTSISNGSESTSHAGLKQELRRFVLHLEGENELVELMMRSNRDATDHWMQRGERKQPEYLMEFLGKSTMSQGFKGVQEFDSDFVPSLQGLEPPNCWALPVATLTAIAVSLPEVGTCSHKKLIRSVHEGFSYIRLVEETLEMKGELLNIRKAAEIVWLGVDLYQKWLDVDLKKLSQHTESTKEILEGLADAARNRFEKFKTLQLDQNQCLIDTPSKWPLKVLAANSMYRISKTILRIGENRDNFATERLFDILTVMISDVLAACLTNLNRVIFNTCLCSSIEKGEGNARSAVFRLGKMKKILKLLDKKAPLDMNPDQLACIDEWRCMHKVRNSDTLFSEKSNAHCTASNDLYLNIEPLSMPKSGEQK